jgi:hypothetical protein
MEGESTGLTAFTLPPMYRKSKGPSITMGAPP